MCNVDRKDRHATVDRPTFAFARACYFSLLMLCVSASRSGSASAILRTRLGTCSRPSTEDCHCSVHFCGDLLDGDGVALAWRRALARAAWAMGTWACRVQALARESRRVCPGFDLSCV